MHIVWKRPDGGVSITYLSAKCVLTPEEHSIQLQKRGDVPLDWEVVGYDIASLSDRTFRNAWEPCPINGVKVNFVRAQELTKSRLRIEREMLLQELDVKFQRNLEVGNTNEEVIAEKNRLRDITKLVDACSTLEELKALKC